MLRESAFRGTAATNKVLRNTFLLLALTLLPTILGVYLGIDLGVPELMRESPWLSLGGFLLLAFSFLFGIHLTANHAVAIPLTLLFTFVMGGGMSGLISLALGVTNGAGLIALAFAGTCAALVGCSAYAATTKRDFSGMGGFLLGAVLAIVVVGVLNILLQLSWLVVLLAAVALVVFTVFLIYDVQQVVNGGQDNYVLATVGIYLDLLNIFSSLLQLLLAFTGFGDD